MQYICFEYVAYYWNKHWYGTCLHVCICCVCVHNSGEKPWAVIEAIESRNRLVQNLRLNLHHIPVLHHIEAAQSSVAAKQYLDHSERRAWCRCTVNDIQGPSRRLDIWGQPSLPTARRGGKLLHSDHHNQQTPPQGVSWAPTFLHFLEKLFFEKACWGKN